MAITLTWLCAVGVAAGRPEAVTGRPSAFVTLRGGFKAAEDLSDDVLRAHYACKEAAAEALASADPAVSQLMKTLEAGTPVQNFGEQAAKVIDVALEAFDAAVPKRAAREVTSKAREALKVSVHQKLVAAYQQQLQVLSAKALAMFQESLATPDMNVQGMLQSDSFFVREAAAAIPEGADWSYQAERQTLQNVMQTLDREWKKGLAAKIQAAQQMSTAMQYLQVQQAQLQQLQQQVYGSAGKWNVGAAYRPPDTNVNLSFNHANGRTNIVASMVPDEQSSLLGPNGFTNGVGPANLGVTFNVNV